MADLIDRHALIANLNRFAPEHYNALINSLITKEPTVDAVEVVRCKDCEYGELDITDDCQWYLCRYEGATWNKGDHFCSYGKRREDNG